ncbi:MAG: ABC transporter permease subunit, partial [Pseudomonadales bacterium]|nr:ABC transporter permease subunit [Pseudomonadales bacterium]
PLALPSKWSLKYWQKSWQQLPEALFNTALVGFISALIAVAIVIALLHWQSQCNRSVVSSKLRSSQLLLWLIYLPMLVPQVSFLFGIQVLLVSLGLDGQLASLVWAHLIFVLPYCYLTLAEVFLKFDNRFLQQAIILSQSRWKSFWMIKIPMLFKPIAFSFAISFSVSVSQYLPTLYVAGGRINTITTETVALASGGDDRISASFALWQFWLPLLVFGAAIAIPQLFFRQRKGL